MSTELWRCLIISKRSTMSDLLCRKYGVAWCDVASSVVTMMLHCVANYVVWVRPERIQSSQISLAAYLTGCAQLYMHITMATPIYMYRFQGYHCQQTLLCYVLQLPSVCTYYFVQWVTTIDGDGCLTLCIDCGAKPRPHAVHVVLGVVLLC